jgi:hypothetical protein
MRLTNLDRTALGRPALAVDPTLVALARDAAFSCPSNSAATIHGRALDMAERDYFSHSIEGCRKSDGTEYGALDILYLTYHYNTYRGENIAWNNYPKDGAITYDPGCAAGTTSGCPGDETSTLPTVAAAQWAFMNSSGHRANLLGDYDRFGCGSGVGATGKVFYACLFSKGGPVSAPTGTTTGTTTPTGDTTRPRVTNETGRNATYRRGYTRTFSATLSDNVRVKAITVWYDGRRIGSWTYSTAVTSVRRSIRISSTRLTRGRHTLVWKVRDAAGNVSTYTDGKVTFTIR